MINEFDLADSINETIEAMCHRTIDLYDNDEFEDANAIIGEWTLENEHNILTKHLQDQLNTIKDHLLYIAVDDGDFSYGEFTFCTDEELPIDNN